MKQKISQIIACIGLCSLLAACSTGPEICEFCPEGPVTLAPKKATGRPYQIKGVWYHPQPYYEYEEEGMASLYGGGDGFHGRPTATGERFDMNKLTAAHKTVPLPCMAKVTNLENGRELIVKVNDRGPFIPGRIIDLSRRGAQLLGFENKGVIKVRVTTLVPESLALNGIDPLNAKMAQAPRPSVIPAAHVVPMATSRVAAKKTATPKTFLEILEQNAEADEMTTPPVSQMVAETPAPDFITQEELPQSEPILLVESPRPPSPSPRPVEQKAAPSTGIFVDVGQYETYAKAESSSRSLEGVAKSPVEIIKNKGPHPYVTRLGPFASMSQANQLLDQLGNAGHLISRIVIQH